MDLSKIINDFFVKYGKGILGFSALAIIFWCLLPVLAKVSAQMYYGKLLSPSKENAEMLALMGDHLGGSTAPFIGGLACILTFMAFWAQIRANDEVKLQFKVQQFESQFSEMVRLNRENVTEMKINGYTVHEQVSVETIDEQDCKKTTTTIPVVDNPVPFLTVASKGRYKSFTQFIICSSKFSGPWLK